jgi:multicomponent K+:H+ antiporter subunit G
VVHEVLIGILIVVTTPVTLMLVGRAALHRDRLENNDAVPHTARPDDPVSQQHAALRPAGGARGDPAGAD